MVLVWEKFGRNLDGNKKNIGKRTKQKRRPGGTGEGSAGEKAEQGISGQTEPGCWRAGEDDRESGNKVKDESKEKVKKDMKDKNPRLPEIPEYAAIGKRYHEEGKMIEDYEI